jgi:hypothetical protein
VVGGHGQAIVKLATHPANLACLAGQAILPPDLRHGAADRDEVGGRGEQHAAVEGKVPQLRIAFERGGDEVLAGHEHQHIVGRFLELALIGLGAERLDVVAHGLDVGGERHAARGIVGSLERILIGVERDLGVDHQQLVAGECARSRRGAGGLPRSRSNAR